LIVSAVKVCINVCKLLQLLGVGLVRLIHLIHRDVDYLKCILLNCWEATVNAVTDPLLKILTVVIRT